MNEGRTPLDLDDALNEIVIPDLGCATDFILEKNEAPEKKDLFEEHHQKAWDKSTEARCDFKRKVRITRRSDIFFITVWQKSVMGRTLTDIKADESMINKFADEISDLITDIIGGKEMAKGQWCIITTPKRRHKIKNFASAIAEKIGANLNIRFYEDVCSCHSKQRLNAIFTVHQVPEEQNIICFDDFVTTGQTLAAMKRAFEPYNKNMMFFAGINNQL